MSAAAGMQLRVSHVGICVTDLERSLRFYCDGLGFAKATTHEVGKEFTAALELRSEASLTAQFIRRDGVSLELLYYSSPPAEGAPSSRRNQLGFTHLALAVDDVDAVARQLVACGGRLVPGTRTTIRHGDGRTDEFVFVADPDGLRVELMKLAAAER
jgi:catechol 2,3-dioxygenase-like lactoylglutathione lyase family enzyme